MEAVAVGMNKKQPTSLTWSHVSSRIRGKSKKATNVDSGETLRDLSGIARPGEILAIMGASGVGKTTLMNVLSGRHGHDFEITGKVYLNTILTRDSERAHSGLIGHIEQHELFVENSTLEEHLIFQAMLRMPREVPDDERRSRVNTTILQLNLMDSKTTVIGKLSGGEKKRLAFATALLTEPCVLLVDEPTSGLDTYLAKSIMKIIHSIAIERGQAVVVVLHQPTDAILDLIDRVYLIGDGGQQAFFGTKDEAQRFFITECQLSSPTLDGCITQLSAPADAIYQDDINAQKKVAEQYATSESFASLDGTITAYLESIDTREKTKTLATIERSTFGRQLRWLLWRSLLGIKRNPKRTTKLLLRLVIMAIILGIVFFRLNRNSSDYIMSVHALFILPFLSLLESNMSIILVEVPTERPMFIWEYRRLLYSTGAYYLTRLIIDTCYHFITTFLFISILVVLTGLSHYILLICVFTLTVITACSSATFVSTLVSTPRSGLLALHPVQNIFVVFSGYYINLKSVPAYLKWIQYLSSYYYGFHLLLEVQWHNTVVRLPCTYSSFSNRYVTDSTKLYNTTCTDSGDDILSCFDISYADTGKYIAGLFALTTVLHLAAFTVTFFRIRRAV